MKLKLLLLVLPLLAFAACRPARLNVIPEFNPPLRQEEVFEWTGQAAGKTIFPCAAGIGWVDASGQIVTTWDPEKKAAGDVYRLPFAVSELPFCQGNFLVLRNQADRRLLIFDLAGMETRFTVGDFPVRQVLAVDGEHIVYLDDESLVVRNWHQPGSYRQPAGDQDFFNCHFLRDRILIMGSRQLFVYRKQNGEFQLLPLPLPAAGAFAYHDENIYYGSSQRQLVKYSLRGNKLDWKVKLGHDLKRQPHVQDGTVVVSPADNSVLQFNRRGSVSWWLALDSILEYSLVPLAGQLAAFLLSNEIKFIDVRRQAVSVFKISGRPAGTPLAYKNELYFIVAAGPSYKLQRVGNHYGIDVEQTPRQALLPWVPVIFSLRTNNLLRPRIQCVIRDEGGQELLMKKFAVADRAQLAWLPKRAGRYRLRVSAAALNRTEEREITFLVFDPRHIILYFFGIF